MQSKDMKLSLIDENENVWFNFKEGNYVKDKIAILKTDEINYKVEDLHKEQSIIQTYWTWPFL